MSDFLFTEDERELDAQARGESAIRTARRKLSWATKEVYQMYGEYLQNLRQPYPAELVEEARARKEQP